MPGLRVWRLPSHPTVINSLRVSWVMVVLWHELGVFHWALRDCRWPDSGQPQMPNTRVARILVIADPQVIDKHSYPGRGLLLSFLSQIMVDLNLRKSWRVTFYHLLPDAVVVLGDMMDSGRLSMSAIEYEAYHERYRDIFKMDEHPVPTYYLPGNHDIGLGNQGSFSVEIDLRYTSHFGPRNHRTSIGNYTLVFIDAPALAEEDVLRAQSGHTFQSWPAIRRGPVEFVKETAEGWLGSPVVLFTHIPLARPVDANCGPLRERGTIRQGFGFGYQNTLMDGATTFLLERLKPSLILSGDDHDYCDYQHTIPASNQKVREVTVKSFSMAMGIRRPGFQLLSLVSVVPSEESLTQLPVHLPLDVPCFLPNQIGIYLSVYVPLLVLSLAILLILNISWSKQPAWAAKLGRRDSWYEPPHHSCNYSDSAGADICERGYSVPLRSSANRPRNALSQRQDRSWSITPWAWISRLGNQKRRVALSLLPCRRRSAIEPRWRHPREVALLRAFGKDVFDVAWPPLCIFLLVAWWVMRK